MYFLGNVHGSEIFKQFWHNCSRQTSSSVTIQNVRDKSADKIYADIILTSYD